jgi:hypothetical protein
MAKASSKAPSVDSLLAAKAGKPRRAGFTAEQRAFVAEVLSKNDRIASQRARLSSREVAIVLREHYGFTRSDSVLEALAIAEFKRTSWAQP